MAISSLTEKGAAFVDNLYTRAGAINALDLAREYPAFEPPEALVSLATDFIRKESNTYTSSEGVLSLRQAIAGRLKRMYSYEVDPESEITITAGATQGIHTAISALVAEGDEVILFEPAHESYVPAIQSNGASPVYITLKKPEFRIDWKEVQKVVSSRTRLILINSPHNPTGTILSAFDLEKLQKITNGTRIRVLSVEVFEYLIYERFEHQSVARFPDLASRSLIVSSFGKAFHVNGWKIGYCTGPATLMEKFRRTQQFQIQSATTPLQHALAAYMDQDFSPPAISAFYQEKRDFFLRLLKSTPYRIYPPSGTFFILLDYEGLSDLKDREYAAFLLEEHQLLTLPISLFHHDHLNHYLLRLCFARPEEQLREAARRLGASI